MIRARVGARDCTQSSRHISHMLWPKLASRRTRKYVVVWVPDQIQIFYNLILLRFGQRVCDGTRMN